MESHFDEKKVETISIPYIHKKIRFSDLNSLNGKLLSEEDIVTIKSHSSQLPDGVVTQSKEKDQDIDIIKSGDKYYAVYGVMGKHVYDEKSLGSGTFGSVHLMQDLDTGEWLVIKRQMPNPDLLDYEDFTTYVERENAALHKMGELRFQHNPRNEDLPFLSAMRLAQGTELQAGVITPKRQFAAVRWFDMALSGLEDLQRIHFFHLVHRDIKGANMILDPATRVIKHVDLGLAVSIVDGSYKDTSLSGTKLYTAPELKKQRKRRDVHPDERVVYKENTDIYAMGIVLKQMFGFRNYDDFFTPSSECHKRIPDPEMRKEIEQLLDKMTDSNPDKRPTLDKVIKAFEAMQQNLLRAPALLNRVVAVDIAEHKELFATLIKVADAKEEVERLQKKLKAYENVDEGLERATLMKLKLAEHELARVNDAFRSVAEKMDSLKKADEIWLVAPTGTDPNELVKMKRSLEAFGMIVNSQAISYQSKENINTLVQSYADQRENLEKNIYIPAHFKQDGTLESRPQVSDRHFDKIIQELQKDVARLTKKGLEEQNLKLREINQCIEELQKLKPADRTYNTIDSKFNELQKKLYAKKTITSKFESMTGVYKSTTRSRVAKLRKETKKIQEEGEQKKKGLSR